MTNRVEVLSLCNNTDINEDDPDVQVSEDELAAYGIDDTIDVHAPLAAAPPSAAVLKQLLQTQIPGIQQGAMNMHKAQNKPATQVLFPVFMSLYV